jgi:hypothetical protein
MRRFDNMETLNVDDFDSDYLSINYDVLNSIDDHHVTHIVQNFGDKDFSVSSIFKEMKLDDKKKAFLYRLLEETFSRMNQYSKAIVDEAMGRLDSPEVISNGEK